MPQTNWVLYTASNELHTDSLGTSRFIRVAEREHFVNLKIFSSTMAPLQGVLLFFLT
jgi:hypothetical protein